jgi:hypothetical protein
MTFVLPLKTFGSIGKLFATILYQGIPDGKDMIWNIISNGRYTTYAALTGILLHINGKFTMGKSKSSPMSHSFLLDSTLIQF